MPGSVKTILTAALLFASVVSGISQTQEAKLVDRIMRPDMGLGNPMRNKNFEGTAAVPLRASPAAGRAFSGVRDASVKDFSTRSFFGLKNPWFGGKVFAAKAAAQMSLYDVKQAGFNKTAVAAGFYGATNAASFGSPVVPVPTYVPAPAAPGSVSRISDKINEKMTIDEVRDLLNKNR
jgi:hypothetical protein